MFEERQKRGINDIEIFRVEQLYPFPHNALLEELKGYKNAEFVWCQEEPKNQGYWSFVDPLVEDVLTALKVKNGRARYVGRIGAAAPATGLMKTHQLEQAALVNEALTL